MELDLNKFRTLIPISALYEDNLLYLADFSRVERFHKGEIAFDIGDQDNTSIFLMSGEIRLTSAEGEEISIIAGTDKSLYALATRKPRRYRGEIVSDTGTIVRVDTRLLEKLLAWGQFSPDMTPSVTTEASDEGPSAEDSEWMMSMMRTPTFLKLPAANIQALFSHMVEIHTNAGDEIIHMGDPGDYYYVIKEGRCRVTLPSESGETVLAELGKCSSFGEEALISDTPRNASVSMLTSGRLMRLSKQDFLKLMEEPLLQWVDQKQTQEMMRNGAVRIDVRFKSEYGNNSLPGAINIPLHQLRSRMKDLDQTKEYIVYCDTGQRSSAAAFIMSQNAFNVYVMKGGLAATTV